MGMRVQAESLLMMHSEKRSVTQIDMVSQFLHPPDAGQD